jgi:hypothetical protein
MLSNQDLQEALAEVSRQATDLSRQVGGNGDLAAAVLASGYVEVGKLADRLSKLADKLGGGNGTSRRRRR